MVCVKFESIWIYSRYLCWAPLISECIWSFQPLLFKYSFSLSLVFLKLPLCVCWYIWWCFTNLWGAIHFLFILFHAFLRLNTSIDHFQVHQYSILQVHIWCCFSSEFFILLILLFVNLEFPIWLFIMMSNFFISILYLERYCTHALIVWMWFLTVIWNYS